MTPVTPVAALSQGPGLVEQHQVHEPDLLRVRVCP